MRDVYLLTEGANGQIALPHLTLTFLASGIAVDKADGEAVWEASVRGIAAAHVIHF